MYSTWRGKIRLVISLFCFRASGLECWCIFFYFANAWHQEWLHMVSWVDSWPFQLQIKCFVGVDTNEQSSLCITAMIANPYTEKDQVNDRMYFPSAYKKIVWERDWVGIPFTKTLLLKLRETFAKCITLPPWLVWQWKVNSQCNELLVCLHSPQIVYIPEA